MHLDIGEKLKIGSLIPFKETEQIRMRLDEISYCVGGLIDTAPNIALEAFENGLLSEPSDDTQISLITSFPFFANDLIPFLERPNILAKLIIFAPFFDDLECIQCFSNAFYQAGADFFLARSDLEDF